MTTTDLPPKPDPRTGKPRPPEAPLWHPDKSVQRNLFPKMPTPPTGEGVVLETWVKTKAFPLGVGLVTIIFIGGGYSLGMGDFSWIVHGPYWTHAVVLVGALLTTSAAWRENFYAGADWVKFGKDWVNTYELTEISVASGAGGSKHLILKDSGKRSVNCQLAAIQGNSRLWDLVYNGLAHSIAHKNASLKGVLADDLLKLERYRVRT